jgi:YVTN family beta-propeller protein
MPADRYRLVAARALTARIAPVFALLAALAAASPAQAEPYVYVLGKVPPASGSPWPQRLTVIDAATNTKGAQIPLGRSNGFLLPHAMAISPDGSLIFVVNDYDATVSIVSTETETVVDTLPSSVVGTRPFAVAVSPDGARLYVTGNHQQFFVVDIATRTRVAALTLNQGGSTAIAPSQDGSRIYVMATGSDRVAVLRTAPYGLMTTVQLTGLYLRSDSLSLSADGRYVFVPRRVNLGDDEIPIGPVSSPGMVVVDTATNSIVTETTVPGTVPYHVGVAPNGTFLYVPSYQGTNVHRLSPTTHAVTNTASLPGGGFTTAFLPNSTRAYVAASTAVTVVDTATDSVATTIPFTIGTEGRALAVVASPPPPPPPPSNLRVSAAGNRLSLTWDPPTPSDTVTGYVLEGGLAPGQTLAGVRTPGTTTSWSLDVPSGALYLRMHALSVSGRSAASNEVQVLVNVPQPPSPPTALLGLASGSTLQLSWTNTAFGGTPASLLLDVSGSFNGTLPMPPGETFMFTGVPPGTYTLAVRAMNGAGTSSPSAPVTLTFPGTCPGPPQSPENFAVTRNGSQLTASWDPPSAGPAISNYVLKVSGAMTLTLPLSQRRISGTVPPGEYQLSVFAVNACGNSVETAIQTVTVP